MRVFPFPAVVGQDSLKRALLLNSVAPLQGVLIRGEKGTAKSTAVRGLGRLLPEIEVVRGCEFNCHPENPDLQCENCKEKDPEEIETESIPTPVVDLPLGATEDRVVGSIDVEKALNEGVNALEPGILARANRGILYIDEVNLLDDHLVDVLLDAAASGVNKVEREGVSVEHPADFILVGTMNPEEGSLRPQFLDRFGLQVDVVGSSDPEERIEVVEIAEKFERDPDSVIEEYRGDEERLREKIEEGREIYGEGVGIDASLRQKIAELCTEAGVDGYRADIITTRTARAIAALDQREKVREEDVKEAARLTLPHRMKTDPFGDSRDLDDVMDESFDEEGEEESEDGMDEGEEGEEDGDPESDNEMDDDEGSENDDGDEEGGKGDDDARDGDSDTRERERETREEDTGARDRDGDSERETDGTEDSDEGEEVPTEEAKPGSKPETVADVGDADSPEIDVDTADRVGTESGEHSSSTSDSGRYVRSRRASDTDDTDIDVAVDATVRSAARGGKTEVGKDDLHEKVREEGRQALVVFAVDASGSMNAEGRMKTAKGAVMSLLNDSYRNRDKVAFIGFKGDDAEVLLPPTNSVEIAARHLKELPTGDRTPLSHALSKSYDVIQNETKKSDNAVLPVLVLVTDGKANVSMHEDGDPVEEVRRLSRLLGSENVKVVVLDGESGYVQTGLGEEIARESGGDYVSLDSLTQENVEREVKQTLDSARD
ncbi:magnesium chelatase subunit D family protein [Halorutilales archaeon Cl-col2-1]